MSRDQVNKFQRDLQQQENTFKFEPKMEEQEKVNRVEQVRRDDDVVESPNASIHKIDHSIKWFIENKIKPSVIDNGQLLPVPVMYSVPEKWASIQRQGFIRDDKGKIMTPLIAYSRTSMERRTELSKNRVLEGQGNEILYKKRYTPQNTYDKFSILNNQIPQREYYTTSIPDYVDISYDLVIWCDYTSQLNSIVEHFVHYQGKAWGDTYKYITKTDSYSFETVNGVGEDRIVKATMTLTSHAYLLPDDISNESTMKKQISVSKLVLREGVVDNINKTPNH